MARRETENDSLGVEGVVEPGEEIREELARPSLRRVVPDERNRNDWTRSERHRLTRAIVEWFVE